MAFCGNCGNQLQGDERFCVKCGHDVKANVTAAASSPAMAVSAPVIAQPVAVAPPPPLFAEPVRYAAPAGIPMPVAMPQGTPNRGILIGIVVIVLIAVGWYAYHKHEPAAASSGTQPVSTATLAQQQGVSWNWESVFGFIELSNTRWVNNSKVTIQSATLECDQYAANGGDLAQMRTTLDGPLQPGAATTFDTFQMGSVADYMTRVSCWIEDVTPAGTGTTATTPSN